MAIADRHFYIRHQRRFSFVIGTTHDWRFSKTPAQFPHPVFNLDSIFQILCYSLVVILSVGYCYKAMLAICMHLLWWITGNITTVINDNLTVIITTSMIINFTCQLSLANYDNII